MVGINVTDIWKVDKIGRTSLRTIKKYADVLWWDLINSSMKAAVSIDSLAISIEISTTTINMSHRIEMYDQSLISSLSHKINGSIHNR